MNDRLLIGKGMGTASDEDPRQIVGIVGDVRDSALNQDPQPTMYVPFAQVPDGLTALRAVSATSAGSFGRAASRMR